MAIAADKEPDSRAQHAAAVLSELTNADFTVFEIQLDLQLTNRSEKAINVPTPPSDASRATTGIVLGVQSQQPDGSWKYLNQASFYGSETTKYANCSPLAPGATTEINGLARKLPLLKARAQELGGEPTLRLDIMILCRTLDDTVVNVSTTTAPFRLRLPNADK